MLSKVANPICVRGKPGSSSKQDLIVWAATWVNNNIRNQDMCLTSSTFHIPFLLIFSFQRVLCKPKCKMHSITQSWQEKNVYREVIVTSRKFHLWILTFRYIGTNLSLQYLSITLPGKLIYREQSPIELVFQKCFHKNYTTCLKSIICNATLKRA